MGILAKLYMPAHSQFEVAFCINWVLAYPMACGFDPSYVQASGGPPKIQAIHAKMSFLPQARTWSMGGRPPSLCEV